jgi:hypothetical protein
MRNACPQGIPCGHRVLTAIDDAHQMFAKTE